MRHIVIPSLFLFLLNNCSKGPGITRSYGTETTEYRDLPAFTMIDIAQKVDLYLMQDLSKPRGISIVYGSHLIENIKAEVSGDVLKIEDKNYANWVRDLGVNPRCTLNVHSIVRINIGGAASVFCLDTISASQLYIAQNSAASHDFIMNVGQLSGGITSSGHIIFHGFGGIFAFSAEDGGWFDASDMQSEDAYIYQYCDHDCYVNPAKVLQADLYAAGNLYYYSEPLYTKKVYAHGTGQIIKK